MLEKLSIEHNPCADEFLPRSVSPRYLKVLHFAAVASFVLMVIAQFLMIFTFQGEQISDARAYLRYATECADNGWWYPATAHIYSRYLFGNGFVNMMALILRMTRNLKVLYFINLIFVQILLWSSLYILRRVFQRDTLCCWFAILFCLLNTMWSEIVALRTEIPFTALAFLALALLFTGKKYISYLSGVVLALANWIRPLGIVFLITAMLIIAIYLDKKKHRTAGLLAGYIAAVTLIGCISFANCGYFVYQASTAGVNLLMSANDDADGSYMSIGQEGMAGYIPSEKRAEMTFQDYDKYYISLSLEWIKRHPFRYLAQTPAKLFYLYATETYAGSPYFHNKIDSSGIVYIKSLAAKITGASEEAIQLGDVLVCLDQLWYMIIAVLCLIGTVVLIREKQWRRMFPFWAILFFGTGVVVIVVGGARYHFPYLPVIMMPAAVALEFLLLNRRKGSAK